MEQKVVEEKSTEETMPTIIEQPKVIDSELKPSESPLLDKRQQLKPVEGIIEKSISSSNLNSAKKK